MRSWSLRRWIHLLGAASLVACLAMSVLSYAQAPTLWQGEHAPRAQAFFDAVALRLAGASPFRFADGNAMVIATSFLPLAVATVATLALLLILLRHRGPLDAATPRLVLGWALAFGAACLPAFPVFTQDFWLSLAWGRMIAGGVNPYHTTFPPGSLAGLPLDHFPMAMSYGPLWGLLSGGIMALSGGSVLAAAILFKLLLAAAWAGTVVLVDRIARNLPARDRCLAIAVVGWTPLSATQSLAEGHNDIAMVWLIVLWLCWLLEGGRWTAPGALVASVLCKYTTLPLFLVDAACALGRDRGPMLHRLARYARTLVVPGLVGLALLLLFFRSWHFFDGITLISAWQFLQPGDAVEALEELVGFSLLPLSVAVIGFFPVVALHRLAMTMRAATVDNILRASLAVMAAVLFSAIPHLWSWYLIWVLAPAALVPGWWLSRFVVGAAIMTPFTVVFWWIESLASYQEPAALGVYLGALAWTYATRPSPSSAVLPSVLPARSGLGAAGGVDR